MIQKDTRVIWRPRGDQPGGSGVAMEDEAGGHVRVMKLTASKGDGLTHTLNPPVEETMLAADVIAD